MEGSGEGQTSRADERAQGLRGAGHGRFGGSGFEQRHLEGEFAARTVVLPMAVGTFTAAEQWQLQRQQAGSIAEGRS